MKLTEQSAEILKQENGEIGVYKQVEKAARLCYKSEDKITENSYENFIKMLKKNGHNSPFEHGTVYLKAKGGDDVENTNEFWDVANSPYSKTVHVKEKPDSNIETYITTNYRVILEHNALDVMKKCICEPTKYHEKRISVRIVTDRAISHELVRHRVFSFSQESQRYCNYNKDKFGGEITFIIPNWVDTKVPNDNTIIGLSGSTHWAKALLNAEKSYMQLLQDGWKPQEAREVLPNSTKTELIMTGFESQWEDFFKLRCSKAAHPMMQELATKIKEVVND